ncbi:hypothetical protein JX266_003812 [Neoarthrinium moseri]|nr:hypothetical protein JX266_003812 [Neoarthrinium moseri]
MAKQSEPVSPPASEDDEYYKNIKSFFSGAITNPNPKPPSISSLETPYANSDDNGDARIMADPAIAAAVPRYRQPGRTMFVTIGSIASFKTLIQEVLSEPFLHVLEALKFNRLIIQCGPDLEYFEEIRPQKGFDSHWIAIEGFSYTDNIKPYYLKCTPSDGAGTILESLNVDARVIVVPNTSLMDNHQLELAEELARQGYLVHGHLGKLHEDVEQMETFQPTNWPPKPPENSVYRHLGDIIGSIFPNNRKEPLTAAEKSTLPLEQQMWNDMVGGQPFSDGDPRHDFLSGHWSEKKNNMYQEWRQNWYAKKKLEQQLAEGNNDKAS